MDDDSSSDGPTTRDWFVHFGHSLPFAVVITALCSLLYGIWFASAATTSLEGNMANFDRRLTLLERHQLQEDSQAQAVNDRLARIEVMVRLLVRKSGLDGAPAP